MMGPINYGALMAQLDLSPLQRGFAMRNERRADEARLALDRERFSAAQQQQQQETALKQREQARKESFFKRFGEVSSQPTADGWQQLRGEFPEYHTEVGNGQKDFTTRQNLIGRDLSTNLYARLHGGDSAGALQIIDSALPTLQANGLSTDTIGTVRQLVASGKPEQMAAANRITTMMLAQYSGDRFGDVLGTLGREDREADLHPYRVDRAEADADYAETRARYAPQLQAETLRGKQARTAKTLAQPVRRGGSGGGGRAAATRPPTMAGTMAPILAKVARGENLTAGEQQAWSMYRSPGRRGGGGPSATGSGGGGGGGAGLPRPASRADFDRLPKGAKFIDPKGTVRVK